MKLEYKSFLEGELKIAIIMCSILTIVALVALIFPFTYKSDRAYKIFAPILL